MATEKRLIDANALGRDAFHIEQYGKGIRCVVDWDDIEAAPTVEAVEVVHGEWIEEYIYDKIICDVCGHEWNILDNDTDTFNYCPNCGADMRGDGNAAD